MAFSPAQLFPKITTVHVFLFSVAAFLTVVVTAIGPAMRDLLADFLAYVHHSKEQPDDAALNSCLSCGATARTPGQRYCHRCGATMPGGVV
jgi:uncharacterized paraquat-inducible protein A